MRHWKIAVPSAVIGLGVATAVTVGSLTAGAAPRHRPPAPAVPKIVNADGSLNMTALSHIPVWEPAGYTGPVVYASTVMQQRLQEANLTPTQIAAMTPAQRAAHGLATAP